MGVILKRFEALSTDKFLSIRWKVFFLLTISFSILFVSVFVLFYKISIDLARENLFAELLEVAHYAAEGIDGDLHQALYEDPEYDPSEIWPLGMTDERYWKIAQWLYSVHRSNPRALLYTYVSPEPGKVEFIVSMGPLMDPIIGAHFGELYIPQHPSVILDGLTRETLSKNVVTDKWGSWVSCFVPIYNSKNKIVAAVGVDYKADTILEIQNRLKKVFIPVFFSVYLILLTFVIYLSNRITFPLISLADSAKLIGEGKPLDIKLIPRFMKDEMSILEEIIFDMGQKVQSREEELNLLTEQLHYFYQASIASWEDENNALAMNIHDGILNHLAVMSMEDAILDNPEFDNQFQELTNRIRSMMSSLRPVMLNYGLWFVLEEYVEECSNRIGIESTIQLDLPFSDVRFDQKTEEHLFRIIQQACENALRHSKAQSIKIDGLIAAKQIKVIIEDDGIGLSIDRLDLNSLLKQGHFGLASMFERASLIGANLDVISSPSQGLQVVVLWENPDD